MKKLLFIGHSYHNKTKSSQFIQDLLKEKYQVMKFNFDPESDSRYKFEELKNQEFDVVVLWQIMPSLRKLKEIISFKHIAFFPMYDGVPSIESPIWSEYRECNIINFSRTLHNICKKYGLSSYYIQYFPQPAEVENWGDEKSVFLWQRIEDINPTTIEKTLNVKDIKNLYHHQVPDPAHKLIVATKQWAGKVKISTWFDTKEDMNKYIQDSAIYYAPRKLEGIGMSFLEAMANGRCVIAPNYPTMNEYIKNNVNGYLYDFKRPRRINIKNLRQIQKNAFEYIKNGYNTWEESKYKILDWINANVEDNSNKDLMDSMLHVKQKKKLTITLLKKVYTQKYKIIYIFGFLPIKFIRKSYAIQ